LKITVDGITFDRASYDRDADVLYLGAGDPAAATDFDGTPEGHHVRYDADGRLIGVTFVNASHLLHQEGSLRFTAPLHVGEHAIAAETVARLLAA